jgi:hypothetical protein
LVLTLTHPLDATLRTARRAIGDGLWPTGEPLDGSLVALSSEEKQVCIASMKRCLFCKNREEKIDLEASRYGFYDPCPSPVPMKPRMT